jgi:hypothetical protein
MGAAARQDSRLYLGAAGIDIYFMLTTIGLRCRSCGTGARRVIVGFGSAFIEAKV